MFEKYDAYKDSALPSFGNVPKHWDIVPLCSITTLKSITNVGNEELLSVYLDKGVIRFDDVTEKRTNVTSLDLSKYQLVEEGDFVLNNQQAWRGSVGVSIYRGIISPAYLVLKLSPKVDAKFANYFFRNSAMVSQYLINSKGVGTIQRNLYWQHLKRSDVVLPPTEEQIEIAEFLDQKTFEIDQAIAIKEQQIALLNERKQIVIQKAVTQGLDPNVPIKDSGVEWIGKIPGHWEVKKIKHVSGEFMYGTSVECNSLSSGTPVLRIPNIDELYVNFDDLKFTQLSKSETENYCLKANDILVIRTNGNPELVGKSALIRKLDGEFLFASYLIRIKPKKLINPEFLICIMNSSLVRKALTNGARTSVGNYNLNTQTLGNCYLTLPPLEEQLAIVEYVAEQQKEFSKIEKVFFGQIEKLKEYKTTLINDAVTGKIKVA